jgi:hypothetical protein
MDLSDVFLKIRLRLLGLKIQYSFDYYIIALFSLVARKNKEIS